MSMALMTFRFASLHLKAALLFLDLEDDIFVRLQLSTWCVSESTMDEVFPRLPFIIIVCSRVSWFLLVNTHSFSSVETGTSPCRIWPSQQFRFFLTWSSSSISGETWFRLLTIISGEVHIEWIDSLVMVNVGDDRKMRMRGDTAREEKRIGNFLVNRIESIDRYRSIHARSQ